MGLRGIGKDAGSKGISGAKSGAKALRECLQQILGATSEISVRKCTIIRTARLREEMVSEEDTRLPNGEHSCKIFFTYIYVKK